MKEYSNINYKSIYQLVFFNFYFDGAKKANVFERTTNITRKEEVANCLAHMSTPPKKKLINVYTELNLFAYIYMYI